MSASTLSSVLQCNGVDFRAIGHIAIDGLLPPQAALARSLHHLARTPRGGYAVHPP
jgi:hypothetical protein